MTPAATRARFKTAHGLLTAYGHGLIGGTALTFLTKGSTWSLSFTLALILGLVFHALALYIAPKGEKT